MVDNLPRLRISESLMKVFLWVLKEAGLTGVPSLNHLRAVQKHLRESCSIPSINSTSIRGNHFTVNDPVALVAKVCTMNPSVWSSQLIHCSTG